MWFDAPPGDMDKPPLEAKWIAYAAAAFSFPVVIVFLIYVYPLAQVGGAGLRQLGSQIIGRFRDLRFACLHSGAEPCPTAGRARPAPAGYWRRSRPRGIGRHGRTWVGTKGNSWRPAGKSWTSMSAGCRKCPSWPRWPSTKCCGRSFPIPISRCGSNGRTTCCIVDASCAAFWSRPKRETPGQLGVAIGIGMNLPVAPILEGYLTVALKRNQPRRQKPRRRGPAAKLNGHLDGVLDLWRSKDFQRYRQGLDEARLWPRSSCRRDTWMA